MADHRQGPVSISLYVNTQVHEGAAIFGNSGGSAQIPPNPPRSHSAPTPEDLASGCLPEYRPTPLARASYPAIEYPIPDDPTVHCGQVTAVTTPISGPVATEDDNSHNPPPAEAEDNVTTESTTAYSDGDRNEDMSHETSAEYNEFEQAIQIDDKNVKGRPQTISSYTRGNVFKVREDKNNVLTNRSFIAIGRSGDGKLVCLALCEHPNIPRLPSEFWDTHAAVLDVRAPDGPHMPKIKYPLVRMELEKHCRLKDGAFLNLEHPYTVHLQGDTGTLRVIPCGQVTSDIKELIENHTKVYGDMVIKDW